MPLDRFSLVAWLWKFCLRPILFCFDAEGAHEVAQRWHPRLMRVPGVRRLTEAFFHLEDPRLRVDRFGITFANPVGLAAGLDKNAEWFDALGPWALAF